MVCPVEQRDDGHASPRSPTQISKEAPFSSNYSLGQSNIGWTKEDTTGQVMLFDPIQIEDTNPSYAKKC